MGLEQRSSDESSLELRRDAEGVAYFLVGRRVRPGTTLEILLHKGQWLRGTFDWDGTEIRWPGLRVPLGGPWEASGGYRPSFVAPIHPQAILRWPAGD